MKIFHCRLSQDVNVSNALARRIIKYFRDDSSKADDFILKTFERGSRYGFGRLAQCYNLKYQLLNEWAIAADEEKMFREMEAEMAQEDAARAARQNSKPSTSSELISAMKHFNANATDNNKEE